MASGQNLRPIHRFQGTCNDFEPKLMRSLKKTQEQTKTNKKKTCNRSGEGITALLKVPHSWLKTVFILTKGDMA